MTIEIRQPELEQRILQFMETGAYSSVEELVRSALDNTPLRVENADRVAQKQSLGDFLRNSPLWGSDLQIPARSGVPRIPEL